MMKALLLTVGAVAAQQFTTNLGSCHGECGMEYEAGEVNFSRCLEGCNYLTELMSAQETQWWNERKAWCEKETKNKFEKNQNGCWVCGAGDWDRRKRECAKAGRLYEKNPNNCWVCHPKGSGI